MQLIALLLLSYLVGSIPTGKIIGNLKGLDIQKHGSGNIGFANSVRVLGWPSGIVVLIVDILKGVLPLLIATNSFGIKGQELFMIGVFAVLGHAFPIWLKFRGGKSIATGLGVLIVLMPYVALIVSAVYCAIFFFTRVSAAGSIIGAWSLPIISIFTYPAYVSYAILFAIFATFTHRENIKNIIMDDDN